MRINQTLLLAALCLAVGACGKSRSSAPDTTAVVTNVGRPVTDSSAANTVRMTFNLSSSVFEANASIPARYTCEGANVSPPLKWTGAPDGAKSFALIVEDPDAPDPARPTRVVSHWVVYDIPASMTMLSENASKRMPPKSAQGSNERGTQLYMGPCPPIGRHRYFFRLFALDTTLAGLRSPKKADVEKAMRGHVVGEAKLIGTYRKAKK